VQADAEGLTRVTLPTMDQTRKLARLEFAGTPARLIGSPGDAAAIMDRTLDVAAIALAAEQLGGAQRALDMAVGYAKVREQFDRPIGSFQTIKHRCADLLLEVESLRSAVGYAAAAVAEGSPEIPVLASLAKAYASETFFHAAAENIQIHGGIGFTWEHDAHLYFKRAKSSELFLGDAAYQPRAPGHPHRPLKGGACSQITRRGYRTACGRYSPVIRARGSAARKPSWPSKSGISSQAAPTPSESCASEPAPPGKP